MQNFILENLELFIVEGDVKSSYRNIKEFSSIYSGLYSLIYDDFKNVFSESDSEYLTTYILENEILDKLKSGSGLFFKNLKDVFFNAALSKKIGLTSAGISLANLFSGYSLSNLVMNQGLGMTATKIGDTGALEGAWTAGIFGISTMFLLLLGATAYKMINTNAKVLIKNYEDDIKESISDLKRFNPELLKLNENSNKLYNSILDQKCANITDKKKLLNCGSKNYMELSTNYILPELFRGYFLYLKSKNKDVSYINSAAELFYYKNIKDRIAFFATKLFDKYNEIFDVILKDDPKFKSECIKKLNTRCMLILKQELKNAK